MSDPGQTNQRVSTDTQLVELSIPARPELLSLPRMTAAAVANQGGFDVEEIEDVRLAIEELCLAAFEGRGPGRLHLRLELRDDFFEVDCRFESESNGAPVANPRNALARQLTEQLLSALADEHGIEVDSDEPRAWFRKVHRDLPVE
jgi:Histidine kinase-like ATPase domain